MSGADLPELVPAFAEWRTAQSSLLNRRVTAREAETLVRKLVDRLVGAMTAKSAGPRDERVTQVEHLLHASFLGTLVALRQTTSSHTDRQQDSSWHNWVPGFGDKSTPNTKQQVPASEVDLKELFAQFAAVVEALDRILSAARPTPPVLETVPWSGDSGLLRVFQNLLCADVLDNERQALSEIRSLRQELTQRQHIDVFDYDPAHADYFSTDPHPDPERTTPRTTRPALVGKGPHARFVRGEALVPRPGTTAPPTAPSTAPSTAPDPSTTTAATEERHRDDR